MSHDGHASDTPEPPSSSSSELPQPIAGLAERLAGAIEHLDEDRKQWIRLTMQERKVTGGLKAGIAAIAGLPGQSTLSDMLSGRIQGRRYLATIAQVLAVDLAWLLGDTRTAPDWALSPLAAFERWAGKVHQQARRRILEPSRSAQKDDVDSGLTAIDATSLTSLIPQLGLDASHPALGHLLAGNYSQVPFDCLITFARLMGVAPPDDPAHVRAGQQDACEVECRVQQAVLHERNRMSRYLLPPQLFTHLRHMVLDARQRGFASSKVCDDALECLWRQHLREQGTSKRHIPEGFRRDTGRTQWTSLDHLRDRYGHNG